MHGLSKKPLQLLGMHTCNTLEQLHLHNCTAWCFFGYVMQAVGCTWACGPMVGMGLAVASQVSLYVCCVWTRSLCIEMIFMYSSGWSLLKSMSFWMVPAANGSYSLRTNQLGNTKPEMNPAES